MSRNEESVITEVEDFIKRFHDGDLVILPKARELVLTEYVGQSKLGLTKTKKRSLADILGWAIAAYQLQKNSPPRSRIGMAYELLDYVERARAYGVIRNENLTNKLKECDEQKRQLKEENDKLQKENIRLNRLNEALHQTIDKLGLKRTNSGSTFEDDIP